MLCWFSTPAAGQSATQTVTFEVLAPSRFSVSGAVPLSLPVGGQPLQPVTARSSYTILGGEANQNIAVQLLRSLPCGMDLEVALAAPRQGSSVGRVAVSTTARDAVIGAGVLHGQNLPITYTVRRTSAGTKEWSGSYHVVYTIMAR